MKITLVAFGIAKDIIGGKQMEYELPEPANVDILLEKLNLEFPGFGDLASLRVAINNEYAPGNQTISSRDEIVLIPPVSGG